MKTNGTMLKILFLSLITFLIVGNVFAKKKPNTIITVFADNDSIRNIISEIDKIDVYVYREKGRIIKTYATKNIDKTFSLYIPVGFVLNIDIGYQNCCGNDRCFQINKGKEINNLFIQLNKCTTPISAIRFLPPCIMEQ